MSQKIYIVEDDASIRELESYALKSAGFETLGFENSRDFFAQMESHLPDLILLDIMLPGTDGLKVLETIRSTPAYSKLPVILVTAKTGEIDAVKGLDSGADDYITKPFGVMELISRVKALLRRIDRVKKEDLNYGTIRIDVSRHTVQVDGNEVELTYKRIRNSQVPDEESGHCAHQRLPDGKNLGLRFRTRQPHGGCTYPVPAQKAGLRRGRH